MERIEKHIEDGKVAVLYSPGWGAGWSTWNEHAFAIDKRIVEKFINEHPSENEMEKFIKSLGYKNPCMLGYEDLKVEWVPEGEYYFISEYDGYEEIKVGVADVYLA